MTDELDPTVSHGEEGPSENRKAQNHGSRENGPLNSPRLHQALSSSR